MTSRAKRFGLVLFGAACGAAAVTASRSRAEAGGGAGNARRRGFAVVVDRVDKKNLTKKKDTLMTREAESGQKERAGKLVGLVSLRGTFQAAPDPGTPPWARRSPAGISGDAVHSQLRALVGVMPNDNDDNDDNKDRRSGPYDAVVLRIDSPGGSPLEASKVFAAIQHAKKKLGPSVPVIAFVDSLCASAGYYAACGCDEIVCDPNSIVGSIGVVSAPSVNVSELFKRWGVDVKIMTSGANKNRMNPFEPRKKQDELFQRDMLMRDVHDTFIQVVKSARGDRLKPAVAAEQLARLNGSRVEEEDGLFDGCYYIGERALAVGFVDEVTTAPFDMWLQHRFGDDVAVARVKRVAGSPLERLLGPLFDHNAGGVMLGGNGTAASMIDDAFRLARDCELYGRFGLGPPR